MTENERIVANAKAGDPAAQEMVALSFEAAKQPQEAAGWMSRAAAGGKASAVGRLGLWELVGYGVPRAPAQGVAKLDKAAAANDAFALHVASVVHAAGIGTTSDLGKALGCLVRLADMGESRAACQLALMSRSGPALAQAARLGSGVAQLFMRGREDIQGDVDWRALAASIDLTPFVSPIVRMPEREEPPIWLVENLLEPWICDYVIAMSAPVLTRGKVLDETGGESVRQERSNTVMNFGLVDSDVILELVNLRLAAAAGMPPENAEALGVLHYAVGERYAPHVDYIPETLQNAEQLRLRGQRVRTLLVYLNDGFEGGATEFPHLKVAYKPPRGCALIFDSVKQDGSVDPMTLHAGASPTAGQKWVISKWFRNKALRPAETA